MVSTGLGGTAAWLAGATGSTGVGATAASGAAGAGGGGVERAVAGAGGVVRAVDGAGVASLVVGRESIESTLTPFSSSSSAAMGSNPSSLRRALKRQSSGAVKNRQLTTGRKIQCDLL